MKNKTYAIVAASAALTCSAFAGSSVVAKAPAEASLALGGTLEVNSITNYTFRGQVLDSNPGIAPKLSLQASLFSGGTLQASVEQLVGTKGSALSRTQYDIGVALRLGKFQLTPGFQVVDYPNDGGRNAQYLTGTLTLDDKGMLPVTLNPFIAAAKAVSPKGGEWYEVGVAPSIDKGKFVVSFPLALGASSNSYYSRFANDLSYSYARAGITGVYHVTDRLSLKASVTGYTTDSKLSNASNNFVTSTFGIGVSF